MALQFFPKPGAEEKRIRDLTRDYAEQHLRPFAIEDDEQSRFRVEAFRELGRRGLASVVIPKAFGGLGLSHHCYYAGLQELAHASVAMAVVVGVTNLTQGALITFGSDSQRQQYLPKLARGEWLGAFSLSEPGAGSDAAALKLAAKKATGGYLLNGTKLWCSNAGHADLYLVMARTGEHKQRGITAFLIPNDTKGFRVGKQEKKLGLRASSLAELIFEDCFVPDSSRMGHEGDGLSIALGQLDSGRIAIGSASIGLATEALNRVWKYRAERCEGSMLDDGVSHLLAEHYAKIQAIKSLLRDAATLKDAKEPPTLVASQIKLLGSDMAMLVAGDAVQFMGEDGYLRANEVERMMRDAKAMQIVEGTNQIQRMVLAREMVAMLKAP